MFIIDMDDEYITTTETKKILKVCFKTISRWTKDGKIRFITAPSGRKRFNIKDVYNIANGTSLVKEKKKICYARVSSKKQVDDLGRQEDFFRTKYPDHNLVTDVGSGLNWKRKGLQTILEQTMRGYVSEVVVAHRDRLCRFGFELLEWIFSFNKVKLVVLDQTENSSSEQELADDILSIVHVYSCRQMGRRRYKNSKSSNIPESTAKESTEEMDGNETICLQ
jgi:putative resolvase